MMKKFMSIGLTLILIPVFLSASETASLSQAPVFSILTDNSNRIIPEDALRQELPSEQRHLYDSLYYCAPLMYSAIGLTGGGTWEGAIRLTPTELGPYTGWDIIAITFRHYESPQTGSVVKIYDNGTPTSPGPVISSEPYDSPIPQWIRVDLSSPVTITGTGDLWCSVEVTHSAGEYPLGVDPGPAVDGKGDWLGPGTWQEIQNQGLDYNWMIRAIVRQLLANDAATISIDMPDWLQPDTTISPMATVKNVGSKTNTFNVTCEIEPGGYSNTQMVTDLAPDDSTQVVFNNHIFPSGDYTVTVYTQLGGDGNPANDTMTHEIEVSWTDVMPVSIDIPAEVPTDTTLMPQATVANFGSEPLGFLVSCRIEPGGYYKNTSVPTVAPNESLQITFNQEFTFLSGVYTATVYTRLASDNDHSNDTLEKVIDATGIAEEDVDTPVIFSLRAPTISKRRTTLEITIPAATWVDLLVYDVTGRLSRTLVSERLAAGIHIINAHLDLPAGVYFYNLKAESEKTIIRKFLIIE